MPVELGRFAAGDEIGVGALHDGELSVLTRSDDLPSILAAIRSGDRHPLPGGDRLGRGDVRWLPPIDPGSRVFAAAMNFRDHAAEGGSLPFPRPLFFYKPPSSFVGHGGTLDARMDLTSEYDYEGEIGIVIGERCSQVPPEDALSVVVGICPLMDGSARDLQRLSTSSGPVADWLAGKGLDQASGLGPTIVCGPEVEEALERRELRVETHVNSELMQNGALVDLIFSVEELIATLSSYLTLQPGDVIATGTPAGVGAARNRFLQPWDEVEVTIKGFSTLWLVVGGKPRDEKKAAVGGQSD